ncbi:MAG TPA: KpsF/GutQ family sugar-phosphate isomerase [Saprospiraceae bacterium]|nr:KpsF/GutQ family sugar-phosphate isomerase [Saprospiraceae bacterium]HRO72393.1 KpsF/GutQ family sugar-phosphate isomerase [Saprospiraceae bacterium]HRP41117.1 KpsF/GutQ family sugar-phosphate isomerase [Saprospiraceae bacterium]
MDKQILIKKNIQKTIELEANALFELKECVNDDMCNAVMAIFHSKGRLIVTGIGKSAIVAQKLVATFNSTGTTAMFMHAADAIHGDLGMIQKDDLVLCISKSGDTPEIKVLVPLIKNFGNILIGMVSNNGSYLAQKSDYVLYLPMDAEADPNNLAPTTSTTLQMAIGDAMAVALLSLRQFSPEHFARYHPGGSLGKQLYLKVADVTNDKVKPKVYSGDNLKIVIVEISTKRLGATAVMDDNENLIGIITDGDLRRMLEENTDISDITAGQIMSRSPKYIQSDMMATEALALMRMYSITQLLVMDGNRYKGIIHIHELIKEGII